MGQPIAQVKRVCLLSTFEEFQRKVTLGVLFCRKVSPTCFKYVHSRVAVCVNCGLCLSILWITWAPKQSLRYERQIMFITWRIVFICRILFAALNKSDSTWWISYLSSSQVTNSLVVVPLISKYARVNANCISRLWLSVLTLTFPVFLFSHSGQRCLPSCRTFFIPKRRNQIARTLPVLSHGLSRAVRIYKYVTEDVVEPLSKKRRQSKILPSLSTD